jgi:thiamine pyrophosphokinase
VVFLSQASKHIKHCVIITNGDLPEAETARRHAQRADLLLAADGGAAHALALGLSPDVVIGDLDSLDPDQQTQLYAAGTRFIVHPAEKDETDLELALLHAATLGAKSIVVLGVLGGRLDQTLANILLLTLPALVDREVYLVDGGQTAFIIRDEAVISGKPGDTVSLIPLGNNARGVTTAGLKYALDNGALPFGPALGLSNEMTEERAHVWVRDGLLLCIHLSQLEEV